MPRKQSSTESHRLSISRFMFSRKVTKDKKLDKLSSPSPEGRMSSPEAINERTPTVSRSHKVAMFGTRQLPRFILRHPSVDGSSMSSSIVDGDEHLDEILSTRSPVTSRCWADSESSAGPLRDSRESSGFSDSHEIFDDVMPQAMTAPVSPSVPLSNSRTNLEGWKYSSQKLLWRLKPRYINFSHNSSTSSSIDSAWKSLDSVTWRSVDGAEVVLCGARLEELSEIERGALRLVALQRLSVLLPVTNLLKPKDPLTAIRQKRQKLLKPNKASNVSEGYRRIGGYSVDTAEKRLFGVSLVACMQNERRLDLESRCRSLDDSSSVTTIMGASSGTSKQCAKTVKSEPEIVELNDRKWLYPSMQNLYPDSLPSSPSPFAGPLLPNCSLAVHDYLLTTPSNDSEKETLTGHFVKKQRPSTSSFSCSLDVSSTEDIEPHVLQVPRIVENCTQYLMAYGLNSIGLFRIAGNAKRCRQLRSALEKAGGGTTIGNNLVENTTAHDVATLLKEYFRDLPQSLLPKEHYQAYIAASRIPLEERIEVVRLLVSLLGLPNTDTLYVLLKFLHEVSLHSHDQIHSNGIEIIQGNRMDTRNLATIFAPSILRPDHGKLHATLAENEQQIAIVETMIAHVEEIFRIPKELQCKIYNKLRETDPDRLDRFLNHISRNDSGIHQVATQFTSTNEEVPQNSSSSICNANGNTTECMQRRGSWKLSTALDHTHQSFFSEDVARPSSSSCLYDENDRSEEPPKTYINKDAIIMQNRTRSSSRERDPRETARFSAAAARRRFCNVVRAFRFSNITRSSPDIVDC